MAKLTEEEAQNETETEHLRPTLADFKSRVDRADEAGHTVGDTQLTSLVRI